MNTKLKTKIQYDKNVDIKQVKQKTMLRHLKSKIQDRKMLDNESKSQTYLGSFN